MPHNHRRRRDATTITGTAPAPYWAYEGEDGPDAWGNLAGAYTACDAGSAQSPIDLPAAVPASSGQLAVSTELPEGEVVDAGHTFQLKFETLSTAHAHNSRAVQPLGDRVVTGGTGTLKAE